MVQIDRLPDRRTHVTNWHACGESNSGILFSQAAVAFLPSVSNLFTLRLPSFKPLKSPNFPPILLLASVFLCRNEPRTSPRGASSSFQPFRSRQWSGSADQIVAWIWGRTYKIRKGRSVAALWSRFSYAYY